MKEAEFKGQAKTVSQAERESVQEMFSKVARGGGIRLTHVTVNVAGKHDGSEVVLLVMAAPDHREVYFVDMSAHRAEVFAMAVLEAALGAKGETTPES